MLQQGVQFDLSMAGQLIALALTTPHLVVSWDAERFNPAKTPSILPTSEKGGPSSVSPWAIDMGSAADKRQCAAKCDFRTLRL